MKRQSVSLFEGRQLRRLSRSLDFAARTIPYAGGAVALAALLGACGTNNPQAIDYQSSTREHVAKAPSLAVPPDLMDEQRARMDAPTGGQASLSGYQAPTGTLQSTSTSTVLPATQGLHIEQDGSQRWLVVSSMPPAQLWGQIRAFWQEQGFFLTEDAQSRGIMQTDWKESHAKLDQGIVRNTLSFAVDNSYIAGERDRYRTRLEAGPNGSTYIFISQQGLHEVLSGRSNDNSQWAAKPNDPGLEAVYLGRLQTSLAQGPKQSVIEQQHEAAAAATQASNATAAAMAAAREPSPEQAAATTMLPPGVAPAAGGVDLSEDYDHAWARVGGALDRASFTVDSRDRTRGLYSIRYVDPNDLGTAAQGFWNQLFHGKKEKVARQYQINVKALTPTSTRVAILDDKGEPDHTALGQRIMRLLVSEF